MNCTGIHCRQGRALKHCDCGPITANSDGSDPHAETGGLIELVLDGLLSLIVVVLLFVLVLFSVGLWSAR